MMLGKKELPNWKIVEIYPTEKNHKRMTQEKRIGRPHLYGFSVTHTVTNETRYFPDVKSISESLAIPTVTIYKWLEGTTPKVYHYKVKRLTQQEQTELMTKTHKVPDYIKPPVKNNIIT